MTVGLLERQVLFVALIALSAAALATTGALVLMRGAPPVAPVGDGGLESSIANAPLAFEPANVRDADFVAHSVAGGSLALSAGRAILQVPDRDGERALTMDFVGADRAGEGIPLERLPGEVNSFVGDDRSQWRSGIPTYGRVRYRELYPGVDVDFYGNQRELEYDLRIAPGADPSQVAARVGGADRARIAANGDLVLSVGSHRVRQSAPVAYQAIEGERREVRAAFELSGSTVRFDVGRYDRDHRLIIDPLVLGYSTYLGDTSSENAFDVEVDASGAVYLTGNTLSGSFPVQDEFQTDQGSQDAFITKLNPDSGGNVTLAYSTYLGGSGSDFGASVALDSAGAAYVAGTTASTDFPLQDQFEGDSADGNNDVFVAKLDPDGGGNVTLAYSTYLGGNNSDVAIAAGVDSAGSAFVTGNTASTDFDVQDQFQVDPGDAASDAFVTKLAPDAGGAVTLDYSTYLGGGSVDVANDVAVHSSGSAFVTGSTFSTNFPTADQFQLDPGDAAEDVYVTKLAPDGGGAVALDYSTYLGGADGGDFGEAIAVDSSGAAYMGGWTFSTDYPLQDPLQGDPGDASQDVVVTKIAPDSGGAVSLAYSTYLGGDAGDEAFGIAVDPAGAAYLAGETDSTNYPTLDALQTDIAFTDGLVTKLNPDAGGPVTLAYSTYLGSTDSESLFDIDVDASGVAYLAGSSSGADYPLQDQFQGYSGAGDAVVTALQFNAPTPPPDSDGDGVPDASDLCPNEPGPASNSGCPEDQRQLEPPVANESVNVGVVEGVIFIKRPGDSEFTELLGTAHIPLGTIIDARNGTVEIVSASNTSGGTRTARFWDGVFAIEQEEKRGTLTTVADLVPKFGCGKRAAATTSAKGGNGLWGSEKGGGHKTNGNKGSGSTRGTIWYVADTCNGKTIAKVTEGKVKFKDFEKKKTVILKPGDKYVAG